MWNVRVKGERVRGVGAVFSASLHVTAVETGIVKHSSRWEAGVFQGNVMEAGANIIFII